MQGPAASPQPLLRTLLQPTPARGASSDQSLLPPSATRARLPLRKEEGALLGVLAALTFQNSLSVTIGQQSGLNIKLVWAGPGVRLGSMAFPAAVLHLPPPYPTEG